MSAGPGNTSHQGRSLARAISVSDSLKKHENSPGSRRKPSATSLYGARTRKELALAELREMEVRQKRGALLDADTVVREWSDVLRQVRAGVLAVTSRVRAQLPHLTAHDAGVLDRELRQALTALADDDA